VDQDPTPTKGRTYYAILSLHVNCFLTVLLKTTFGCLYWSGRAIPIFWLRCPCVFDH